MDSKDSGKFVAGQLERNISWNDLKEDCCQTNANAVKHEPCEFENFNECGRQETSFVNQDQEKSDEKFETENLNHSKFFEKSKIDCNDLNEAFHMVKIEPCEIATHSSLDLSEEKLDMKSLNPEDLLYHSECSNRLKIECNDLYQPFEVDIVKHEPCEIDISTKCEMCCNSCNKTDVDHEHNYAIHRCIELSEEEFQTENVNPEDLDNSKFSEILKVGCNDLNQAIQTDTVKNELCEDDIFTKCGRYSNSYNNETDIDHDYKATHTSQELSEEHLSMKNLNSKDLDHSEWSDKLSTNENEAAQIKNEDYIDIFQEDIKCETGVEKSSEHYRFCEACCQSSDRETDSPKTTSYRLKCSCQKQNKSFYNIDGQDMTCDVNPTSHDDSGLQQFELQDDSIFGNGVTKEQHSSAVSLGISEPPTRNSNNIECIFCLKHLDNSFCAEHQFINMALEKMQCKFCSKCFSCESDLKTHERIHRGQQSFRCKICSKSFSKTRYLRNHEIIHTGEKPFHCKICSKFFSRKYDLKFHEKTHTGEKLFHCEICAKSFYKMSNLKVHERVHTDEKPFHCKICSKSFGHKVSLKNHGICHTGEKPFHCKICSKSFSLMQNLKVHERVHTGEKPFLCKICSKSFYQMGDLKVHERVHTGEKPFHCQICSKSFGHKVSLKTHQRVHTGEKPFLCKICSKSFSQNGDLKVHERVHTGQKPFLCEICSKSFSRMCNLKTHERTHTGEKPFHCNICPKSFSQKGEMIFHQRGHTGEKPFLCKICLKAFSRKDSLKVHERGHTGSKV